MNKPNLEREYSNLQEAPADGAATILGGKRAPTPKYKTHEERLEARRTSSREYHRRRREKEKPAKAAAALAKKEAKNLYKIENRDRLRGERLSKKTEAQRKRERESSYRWKQKNMARVREYYFNNKADFIARSAANVRSRKLARPNWVKDSDLYPIYKLCERITVETKIKHQVDHAVPICSKIVCGLHVPWNLRVITQSENSRKRNVFIEELGLHPTVANGLTRTEDPARVAGPPSCTPAVRGLLSF